METIKCMALAAFTKFVPDYGLVHGDPESSLDEAQTPKVPVSAIADLVADGSIAAPDGWGEPEPEPELKSGKPAKGAPAE